ncbi:DUF975 family protein [Cellulosilyticum sp. I15G10I2]|uniref:DUF975 family protein n=1 Tax=Cellulosilyticum sp. I15G10I2 TaxID=1892843 RepID=UPI00085CB441|nr:DUF975 family protein [Cellulosilyticum sp. I15G10I2]
MWTREELKERAKIVLKRSYWKALLVSFILALVSGGFSSITQRFNQRDDGRVFIEKQIRGGNISWDWVGPAILIAIIAGLGFFIISLAFSIFLANPLEVGARRFFMSLTIEDAQVDLLGYGFKNGRYMNVIKTMFYTNLLIFLWSLLLVIPGIIKGYAYSMVPYILADNPEIDYKRAVALSNQMTMGEKANIWVLDLSFIGWYLLGALACGVGILFVHPYVNATKAELYITLRRRALQNRLIQDGELNNTST